MIEKNRVINYFPFNLNPSEAISKIENYDWPKSVDLDISKLHFKQILLPYNIKKRKFDFNDKRYPQLSSHLLPKSLDRKKIKTATVGDLNNSIEIIDYMESIANLQESDKPFFEIADNDYIFIPFYQIYSDDRKTRLLYNIFSNEVIEGKLVANSTASLERWLLLIILLFTTIFWCIKPFLQLLSSFLNYIEARFAAQSALMADLSYNDKGKLLIAGVSLLVIIWTPLRVRSILYRVMDEPVKRVESGVINIPYEKRWYNLIQSTGFITLLLAIYPLFNIVYSKSYFITIASYVAIISAILLFISSNYIARSSLTISKGGVGKGSILSKVKYPKGDISDATKTIITITLFSIIGYILGTVIGYISRDLTYTKDLHFLQNTPLMISLGISGGANIGVFLLDLKGGLKFSILLVTITQLLLTYFGFEVLTTIGSLLIIFFGTLASYRSDGVGFLKSVQISVGYSLGEVLGSTLGFWIAIFLIGINGGDVGELIGEEIVSILILTSIMGRSRKVSSNLIEEVN